MQAPRPDLEAVLSSLTPREREIVGYVAAGRPNKVIAIDLGISLRTVEAHRSRIFTKLQVRNAMQLACRLCEHGRSGASPVLGASRVPGTGACREGLPGLSGQQEQSRPAVHEYTLLPMPRLGSAAPSQALHEASAPEYGQYQAGPAPPQSDPVAGLAGDGGPFPPGADAGA